MRFEVLASGSNANCYVLHGKKTALLLECGLSIREIKKKLDFDFSSIVGCLITHEHKDHCKSAKEIVEMGIAIYASQGTASKFNFHSHFVNSVDKKPFSVGEFDIIPFSTLHDSAEPLGFLIRCDGKKILFATDTYWINHKFNGLDHIFIECNYQADLIGDFAIRDRLEKSHFELDNLKKWLSLQDLSMCKGITLLHLSRDRSNAEECRLQIEQSTGIKTNIAQSGLIVSL